MQAQLGLAEAILIDISATHFYAFDSDFDGQKKPESTWSNIHATLEADHSIVSFLFTGWQL